MLLNNEVPSAAIQYTKTLLLFFPDLGLKAHAQPLIGMLNISCRLRGQLQA